MRLKRSPRRNVYSALPLQKLPSARKKRLLAAVSLSIVLGSVLAAGAFLRKLSCEIAVSDAQDAVTLAINDSIAAVLDRTGYTYADFVSLQKDGDGDITAILTDTVSINRFSTEILTELIKTADSKCLQISIPLGNLFGSSLLLGRGPDIPVQIIMLTSSFVRCDSAMTDTGINQSRHTVTLRAEVDIDILIPWATVSSKVETDILIAETLIVGRVPETYVNVTEEKNGS